MQGTTRRRRARPPAVWTRRTFVGSGLATLAGCRERGGPTGPVGAERHRSASVEPSTPTTTLPVGMFSTPPDEMAALGEAGLSMAGPFYPPELKPDRMEAAVRAGLPVAYPLGYPLHLFKRHKTIAWSVEQTHARIGAQVRRLAEQDAIGAWYLWPEELRFYRPEDLDYLRAATAAIREHDPKRRPILHYQPNGRRTEELLPVVEELDWAAVGAYPNYAGHRHERGYVGWATEQLVRATEDASRPVTPFVVLEMFQDPPSTDTASIDRWVRHDVYAALVSGAQGLLVFSGWNRPNFDTYPRYFDAYVGTIRELNGPEGLAAPLLGGRPLDCPHRVVLGPTHTRCSLRGGSARRASVRAVRFDLDGTPWTYVVNSAPTRVIVEFPRCPSVAHDHGAPSRPRWDPARNWLALEGFGVSVLRHGSTEQA